MFEHSLTILRIRGIPIRLHLSLLVFLPYVAIAATRQFGAVASSLGVAPDELHLSPLVWGVLLAIGLFVGVLIHELSHSLVALRAGARVGSITLMMLGGVSMIEGELPPAREAWMAFAGPLASFCLAAGSYALFRVAPLPLEVRAALLAFAITNTAIGIFNLLPAFPMDGGRILRGLLAGRLGRVKATLVAARVGQGMAALFAAYGIWSWNLLLVLISWFVWAGATAEHQRAAGVTRPDGPP